MDTVVRKPGYVPWYYWDVSSLTIVDSPKGLCYRIKVDGSNHDFSMAEGYTVAVTSKNGDTRLISGYLEVSGSEQGKS